MLFRHDRGQIKFDLVRIGVICKAESLRQAHDVGVDADRLPAEGVAEDDVGGFAPDAGERDKVVQVIGHFAAEARDDFAAAVVNRPGLVAVEVDLTDLLFERRKWRAGVVFRRSISFKQRNGNLIDEIVASLRREDQSDQQFKRIGEIEIELGVGMDFLEPVKNPLYNSDLGF